MKSAKNESSKPYSTILIALILILLSGCSTVRGVTQTVDPAPLNLRQQCPPMERVKDKALMGDLAEADAELAGLYKECATAHDGLIKWHDGITKPPADKPWWKIW